MKPKANPYAALQFPEFRAYITANAILTVALLIQEVLLGYEVYKITHDPLALGFIGLAEAIPYISLALFGGHVADNRDKKAIMLISLLVIISASLLLIWASHSGNNLDRSLLLSLIYLSFIIIGFAKGFYSPAASSLNPFLVPKEVFANAATWNSSFWQIGAILGPGIAGFLYVAFGLTITLWLVTALLFVTLFCILYIKKRPVPVKTKEAASLWESLKEGIRYVFKTKIILYSISLDLVSVLFGGIIAILPIFAEDILHVGAKGLGLMRAAPSIGALLTMAIMIYLPPLHKLWRNLLVAIFGFGIATLVFGLSQNIYLSLVALFLTGVFDSVSVVIRQTILRHFTPDEMRGRVSAVNGIFVSSSNEIGAFESGLAAKLLGTVPSVLLGAGATLTIASLVWWKSDELFDVKVD